MYALKKTRSIIVAVVPIVSAMVCSAGEKTNIGISDEKSAFSGIGDRKVEVFAQIPEGVFIEGPVFHQEGNLWFAEIGSGWNSRITANGRYDLVFDAKGNIYFTDPWGPDCRILPEPSTISTGPRGS